MKKQVKKFESQSRISNYRIFTLNTSEIHQKLKKKSHKFYHQKPVPNWTDF